MFKTLATDGYTLQETSATEPFCHLKQEVCLPSVQREFHLIHLYSPGGTRFSGYRINMFLKILAL